MAETLVFLREFRSLVNAAATAATPAAATQPTPAAGASGEVRSQVKNQAFPSFLYLQDTHLYPGLVCIYTCFLASQDGRQKFFPVFCGFYSEGCTGTPGARPVRKPVCSGTKMAETLVFLREFRSLELAPAGHAGQQVIPAAGTGNFFGSFREFLRSFGEL